MNFSEVLGENVTDDNIKSQKKQGSTLFLENRFLK